MWVRSEYVGELAVLSAWLCALLPWSVTVGLNALGDGAHFVRIHFLGAFLQFTPGTTVEGLVSVVSVASAPSFEAGNPTISFAYSIWVLGAIVMAIAMVLSVLYYVLDERLEARSPVDPARLMGGLLLAAALCLSAANALLLDRLFGLTIPVGIVFMYVLGGTLVLAERS